MKRFCRTQSQLATRLILASLAVLALGMTSQAQAQEEAIHVDVTAADQAAATYNASNFRYHLKAASTQAGKLALATRSLNNPPFVAPSTRSTQSTPTVPAVPAPGFYGEDLVLLNGKFLPTAKSHPVYVNMSSCGGTVASCFGNPAQFINDLSNSTFIHITDQYVGTTAPNRYLASTTASATIPTFVSNVVGQNDILAAVHAAARTMGTGYGNIYHVFLPKGVDTCFDLTSICYSPDNLGSFVFCAYHGSVTFSDIGHTLFTVIPFQTTAGCNAAPPNPNSIIIDSTNSTLSHELIETITDPDPPSGWISLTGAATAGLEIGDLCQALGNGQGASDPTLSLNGKPYQLQLEYGNKFHACTPAP
jgi:hypothetical protein